MVPTCRITSYDPGMNNRHCASLREDPDTFFFMRGFPDLASREPMKAKFYEGELWKHELENILLPMLEKYEVVVVEDPGGLVHWK
jgi:hypothetical protein